AVHGREVRPRQHLGRPPGHRALDHPGGGPRGAGRTATQPAGSPRPEGRRHHDAQRHPRQPDRTAVGNHPPDPGADGPAESPYRRSGGRAPHAPGPPRPAEDPMSAIAIVMNLLLAGLLAAALMLGYRLNSRLKALRDSHDGFAKAVA